MTESKNMEYFLPPPPGRYRSQRFSQTFANQTADPTLLKNTEPSITLAPNEIVEIEWLPKINSDIDGIWKVRRPS